MGSPRAIFLSRRKPPELMSPISDGCLEAPLDIPAAPHDVGGEDAEIRRSLSDHGVFQLKLDGRKKDWGRRFRRFLQPFVYDTANQCVFRYDVDELRSLGMKRQRVCKQGVSANDTHEEIMATKEIDETAGIKVSLIGVARLFWRSKI